MNRYRLIHFTPDPFISARVPIGAIIEDRAGISVLQAPRLPDAGCLGGQSEWAMLHLLLEDLHQITSIDALPSCMGPHAILDDIYLVPNKVENVAHWVSANVLPGKPKQAPSGMKRAERRATTGYRCFEQFRVSKFVKKTFRPNIDGRDLFPSAGARILDTIAHWVSSQNDLLLMEPIVPESNSHHVLEDSKLVAKRFMEYKHVIGKPTQCHTSLNAYLAPGIDKEHKRLARENLEISADDIFDLDHERDRTRLINRIREIGGHPSRGQIPLLQ
jgi:hypothetical protein